jgi:hypothetical protein
MIPEELLGRLMASQFPENALLMDGRYTIFAFVMVLVVFGAIAFAVWTITKRLDRVESRVTKPTQEAPTNHPRSPNE